jgi:SAM-dependent methyltransferase
VAEQLNDLNRIAFHVELVRQAAGETPDICDIGGGIGLFSTGCAALGMRVTLVDDFQDLVNHRSGPGALSLHRELGVTVDSRDVIRDGVDFPPNCFDAVTSFDSMEHWHASPRRLFHRLKDSLRPGGAFILGVPNCVNLRKRIAVPLGVAQWSRMEDWYQPDTFRGHVREPNVADLRFIAKDLALRRVRILGRNWLGRQNSSPLVRALTPLADHILRLRPSLCANIYLVGHK